MRHSLILSLVVYLATAGLPSFAEQPANSADKSPKQESTSRVDKQTTQQEVEQLRGEVASQKETIQELKSMVQQLAQRLDNNQARVLPASSSSSKEGAHMQLLTYDPLSSLQEQEKSGASASAQAQAVLPEKPRKPPSNRFEWTIAGTTVQIYGHGDVSYDYVDNGITPSMEAANPLLATVPNVALRANNGWLGQLSSNLSYFGVRGSHKINDYLTGLFQFETEVMFTDTPGSTSDLQCKYCLGSRDTYVGISGPWGAIKAGKEDAPYKRTTTGAFDPFINTIADARSIMGNSGGDNRAEFMGRISHAIWYETPTHKGVYASILFAPGQNRSSDNSGYARGEPNCTGGNGAFTLSFINRGETAEGADFNSLISPPELNPCNDGSWANTVSAAVTYRGHEAYLLAGYEHHGHVNRTTDLVGVADEAAWKLGAEYTIKKTGTTPSFVYEHLKRYAASSVSAALGEPVVFPALNERTRPRATWLALRQKLSKKDTFNIDWIHAGKTPGDPGECSAVTVEACTGFATLGGIPGTATGVVGSVNNSSNMYGIGLKHAISRNVSTYFVAARQANHADAHYDLGAVGHGLIVDKKDWTGTGFVGTRIQGVSGGMTFDF